MARPNKSRRVCGMPGCQAFYPEAGKKTSIEILLTVEEYEVIRLMDYENLNQQQAAAQMGVSRTTIQALYAEARKKIARFLVEGTPMKIQGGNYEICSNNRCCSFSGKSKGDNNMRIAVTYEDGQVFQHFGHTEQFKVYEVGNGKVIATDIVSTEGQGHGALAEFLFGGKVDVLICGGIGGGARNALAEVGIELYPGASGDADANVESFLQGKLQFDPNTKCNHHDHEEGHTCGEHGCGNGSCH